MRHSARQEVILRIHVCAGELEPGVIFSLPPLSAVKQLWGDGDHMAEIDDMVAEQEAIRGEKAKHVCDLFRDRAVRWQFITLFLVCSCMQLIGANAVCVPLFSAF